VKSFQLRFQCTRLGFLLFCLPHLDCRSLPFNTPLCEGYRDAFHLAATPNRSTLNPRKAFDAAFSPNTRTPNTCSSKMATETPVSASDVPASGAPAQDVAPAKQNDTAEAVENGAEQVDGWFYPWAIVPPGRGEAGLG
jgi:hypothetical protein